jgi:hypothetical protein
MQIEGHGFKLMNSDDFFRATFDLYGTQHQFFCAAGAIAKIGLNRTKKIKLSLFKCVKRTVKAYFYCRLQ